MEKKSKLFQLVRIFKLRPFYIRLAVFMPRFERVLFGFSAGYTYLPFAFGNGWEFCFIYPFGVAREGEELKMWSYVKPKEVMNEKIN